MSIWNALISPHLRFDRYYVLTFGILNVQAINHYITYSVIASTPALTYTSVLSTIRCWPVTSGSGEGSTFVQWSAHFSSDADAGNVDSKQIFRERWVANKM